MLGRVECPVLAWKGVSLSSELAPLGVGVSGSTGFLPESIGSVLAHGRTTGDEAFLDGVGCIGNLAESLAPRDGLILVEEC